MPATPDYFVRVGAEVRGPYSVGQLTALAEAGVVTPATAAAPHAEGPWSVLETHPAQATIFPPRAALNFKPTEFPTVNGPGGTDMTPPVELRDIIAQAAVPGRVLRPSHPPELEAHRAAQQAAGADNEVAAMVRDVQAREAKFAPPPPPPGPWRPSARLKWVAALALLGNGLLAAIPTFYGAWGDWWTMLIFRGWFVLYNAALIVGYFLLPRR